MDSLKVPIAVAFVVAALVSLVNVSAYKQAQPKNGVRVAVAPTSTAALSLSAAPTGNSANQITYSTNGMMQIHFGKGYGGTAHSLQMSRTLYSSTYAVSLSGDIYQMNGVFMVTNRSADCQNVSIFVPTTPAVTTPRPTGTNLTAIWARPYSGSWSAAKQLAGTDGAPTAAKFPLGAAGSGKSQMLVDFYWSATNAVTTGNTIIIQVSSSVAACP